jgi:hypothetical protein
MTKSFTEIGNLAKSGKAADQVRLWEIAENLHRAELSVLERSEHIAEWVRITDLISSQVVTNSKTEANPKGSGRKESGINKVVINDLVPLKEPGFYRVRFGSGRSRHRQSPCAKGAGSGAALLPQVLPREFQA